MEKLLKRVDATNSGVTTMNSDLSSMSQLVNSHSTSIKQLEKQMSQLSAALNQKKCKKFPSNIVHNPRNNSSCMTVTKQSGKVLPGPSVGNVVIEEDVEHKESYLVDSEKLDGIDISFNHQHVDELEKRKDKEKEAALTTLPKLLPSFPHRLKKKADNTKFSKFMAMLKQLTVNVSLVEALEKMSGYMKFMKDLVMKKREVCYEPVDNLHHCSAISTRSLVQKKVDPGSFTIPCTIGSLDSAMALCDLGASIILMPLVVNKNLCLGDPIPTNM
ncbi:uncharacterized protein LOC124886562 [Capsicum annuum]|uniref:uncharacterized protein LOC124886562 n=1 Tax=Capsicum annuum TaxID=4072 RepID=UPI001FB12D68|nr:uncharacterized protein LOC124886562 [Capsicum annuum]